jgi:DNA-3-methyladenine glycosylase II
VLEKIHSLQPTTLNILDEAEKFLIARAPNLAPLIHKHRCDIFTVASLSQPIDPFQSLISGVIAQQVSGAAASTIKAKFINLFESQLSPTNMTFPTPSMVIAADQATLRTAGLSQRKAEYVCSVAEAFENGDLSAEFLANAGDKEIMDCLVKIRGIGVWSAEMFLIFALRRMDVFSTGDLGIQRGMAAWMGRDVAKLKSGKGKWKFMKEEEMKEISEKFRPYRTLFCWYMWRFEATDVQAMNNAN